MEQSLIDQALLKAGLRTDLPLANITGAFDLKATNPIKILKIYRDLKDFVNCGCGQPHKNGAVTLFENEHVGLVGKDCAVAMFGHTWASLLKNHEIAERTEIKKSLIEPRLQEISHLHQIIKLYQHEAKEKDKFFDELKKELPDIFNKLIELVKYHGEWSYEKEINRTIVDKHGIQKSIRDAQRHHLGTINGYTAIQLKCFSRMGEVFRQLGDAQSLLQKEPYKNENMDQAGDLLQESRRKLASLLEELSACPRFFTKTNFQTILHASIQDPNIRHDISLKSNTLKVTTSDWSGKKHHEIKIPYTLATIQFQNLKVA
jgi:hypothetical protein